MSTLIDVHHGSQSESWIIVEDDGRIILHRENEGHRFLRRGAEATDEEVTLEKVVELDDRHFRKGDLIRRVQAALATDG
jgi:hypothetical protein